MVNKNKAIFLDRDGVLSVPFILNKKSFAPRRFEDFKLYPFVKKYLNLLKKKNFFLIVVTNQPDISNNLVKLSVVNKMHQKLMKLPIDDIYICPHSKKQNCNCRKPKTGMIRNAVKKYKINVKKSFLVGDRITDIEAGLKMNCKNIFINRNYNEKKPNPKRVTYVKSFKQAALRILNYKGI